jgi:hypothetical protein
MIIAMLQGAAAVGVILGLEWSQLRAAGRTTRITVYLILGVSTIIWVYVQASDNPVRPMAMLEKLLKLWLSIP